MEKDKRKCAKCVYAQAHPDPYYIFGTRYTCNSNKSICLMPCKKKKAKSSEK